MNYSLDHDQKNEQDREPDFTKMDGPALLDACGADAMKWATAFCQTMRAQGWQPADIEEGLMVGWFANAIEQAWAVRSEGRGPLINAAPELLEALKGVIRVADRKTVEFIAAHAAIAKATGAA